MPNNTLTIFANEVGAEILKTIRMPEFILPSLLLPVAFYSFFGIAIGGINNATYLLATYGVFAVMGPSIFGFGAGVAAERERGWLKLKRAVPAPPNAFLAAKLSVTLLFSTAALLPVYFVAGFVGGVEMATSSWALLYAAHLLSVVPMVLIGLALGFSFSANGAVAISNIVFLGLAALGGLWIPSFLFPEILQSFSALLPSYHLAEVALSVVDPASDRPLITHLLVIAVMSIIALGLATFAWNKQA